MKSTIKTIKENETGGAESLCQPESYADSLYYPLFPPTLGKKEQYQQIHDKLMAEMREQMRARNRKKIEETGKKLYRLRKRYRDRFAA